MNNLAIIPARGGSKRIPKKNIRPFLGKPIIAYSIEIALKSGLFNEVMVSTDSVEIAEVAQQYGAKVPFLRSVSNANDYATLNDVYLEVVNWYKNRNRDFENYCVILPTSPLLRSEILINGYELLSNSTFDSVRPIVRFDYPIQRAFKLTNGLVDFINPEHAKTRSQDLEPAYHDSGMFYFIKSDCQMSSNNKGAFEIEAQYVQDIDNESDWVIAELKYNALILNGNSKP